MKKAKNEEEAVNQDSSSISISNLMPLAKRQTTAKKQQTSKVNNAQVIKDVSYRIIEEIQIITPLQLHPKQVFQGNNIYTFTKQSTSIIDFNPKQKNQEKQKIGFLLTMQSLYKQSFAKIQHKYCIICPGNFLIYFFKISQQNSEPALIINNQSYQFGKILTAEKIQFIQLKKKTIQREKILIKGQNIRLFNAFFINWAISKGILLETYANFSFINSMIQPVVFMKLQENRQEYSHLTFKEKNFLGQQKKNLYLIKFQGVFFQEVVENIEARLKKQQAIVEKAKNSDPIFHEYEFKFLKQSQNFDSQLFQNLDENQYSS